MSIDKQEPIAWAFYNKNGEIRFIIDDKRRMEAWSKSHEGKIVPLVALDQSSNEETETA